MTRRAFLLSVPGALCLAQPSVVYLGIIEWSEYDEPAAQRWYKPDEFIIATGQFPVHLRYVFKKQGTDWVALRTKRFIAPIPGTLGWATVRHGRVLREIRSLAIPGDAEDALVANWHRIIQPGSVPRIRVASGSPSGVSAEFAFEPLLAISGRQGERKTVPNPDRWHRPRPVNGPRLALLQRIAPIYAEKAGRPEVAVTLEDLEVYHLHGNSAGHRIVNVGNKLWEPPAPFTDQAPFTLTFLVRGAEIRLLDEDLELFEAGDFGGDGKPAVLFFRASLHGAGYVLMWDSFRRSAEWSRSE